MAASIINKKTLIAFGVLDLITIVDNYSYAQNYFERVGFEMLIVTFVLLYVSLVISGILLIMKKKAGIWISYVQFPIRIMFMTLSFGFLLKISHVLNLSSSFYDVMMWLFIAFEVARLVITIQIHRKFF